MKKIISVFVLIAFLSTILVGSVFSASPMEDYDEPVISKEEVNDDESILDLLNPDSAEAIPFEKEDGESYEGNMLDKDDGFPFHESDEETDKVQEEEERDKIIF
jgi:hypothetical protein